MGEVYLAEDTTLHRRVALKVLPAECTNDQDRLRRFQQEATAASRLNHPNIVTIHEAGESNGRYFIATEFIDGETVRQMVARAGPVGIGEALAIGGQIASALAVAHEAGIVHRDIKPENVMVRRDRYVKVLDFGIAKLTDPESSESIELPTKTGSQTRPGAVFGTLPYMSPEQARGSPVDARTDIWSLGCLLYEMLSGRTPFAGETSTDLLVAILDREPTPVDRLVPTVPAELQWIITKTLRKPPAERYQTCRELLADLQRLQHKLDRESHGAQVAPHNARVVSSQRHRSTLTSSRAFRAVVVVAILATVVAGSLWYWRSRGVGEPGEIRSLAILPLKSLDAGENYLGLGIADAVIRKTNQTGGLIVRPTSAVRRYLAEETDALTAARQLNADAVLEGSVQRAGDRLRVSVNLLRAHDGASLWADSFDMGMTDIFTIQDTVARQVSSRLRLKLDPSQPTRLTKRHTDNPLAYDFYLRGLYNFDQRMTLADTQMESTIAFFKQAIDADPGFAAAHAQLAYAYAIKAVFQNPTEVVWAEHARAEIARAQALDPQLAEIELARWQLLFSRYEGFQGEAAVRAILAAQRLDPDIGHAELGYMFTHLGLPDLAERALQRALEIDPSSEFARLQMLSVYEMSGQHEEWLVAFRRLEPNRPIEGWYFLATGRLDEAERAIDAAAARDRFGQFLLLPDKAILAALKGDFRAAEAAIPGILSRHPVKDPFYHHVAYVVARIYALEGKSGEAVKWLREAVASGFSTYALFERDAQLNRIRQAPEFIEFMSEMKVTTDRYRREFGSAGR